MMHFGLKIGENDDNPISKLKAGEGRLDHSNTCTEQPEVG